MIMIDSLAYERTATVVSRIALANAAKRESELKPLLPMFGGIAVAIEEILQSYSTGPVKCSVSTLGTTVLETAVLATASKQYHSKSGNLTVCIRSERAFDALLCEVCFGGTGSEIDDADDKSRPASRIETFLKSMIFDSLFQKLPEVLLDATKSSFVLRTQEETQPKGSDQPATLCVKASILVNVFSISAEVEIFLPVTEVEMILGHAQIDRPNDNHTVGKVLGGCNFKIVVSLPPHEVGLSEIFNLSIGSILKLASTPNDPSHLAVEGILIGKGRLSISTDRLGVTIQ
jgi:flagellar motor switch protein FliM